MERYLIAADLFSEAIQAGVWSAMQPEDELLKVVAADTARAFEDFLDENPDIRELMNAWTIQEEGKDAD
jgi:hypothetical protein